MRLIGFLVRLVGSIILGVAIIGFLYFAWTFAKTQQDKIRNEHIASSLTDKSLQENNLAGILGDGDSQFVLGPGERLDRQDKPDEALELPASAETTPEPTATPTPEPVLLPRSIACLEVNPDYAYWINIPDTVIDYPVVQTTDDDVSNPYLNMDFNREATPYGSIYASSFAVPDNTVILFGHAMKDGSQFKALENYRNDNPEMPNFREEHMAVKLATLYEERDYRVRAVYIFNDGEDLNGDGACNYDDYFGTNDPVAFLQFLASYDGTFYLDSEFTADELTNFLFLQSCTYTDEGGNSLNNARVVVMATMQNT